ncbi:hypothetical protein [Mesorhizobium sp. WSM2239]|jgi:hypothetical protein|uniref:Uncharacterized protein n=2 Tax=unclassified Mesorhizobium TaxID=325217 RepID=A0AAU8DAW8_9HYPH
MEHIAALLLVIGCSQDLQQCQELPAPVPLYETVEECETEVAPTLSVLTGQRPKIFAKCVTVDPALAEEDVVLEWDVLPDGTLYASLDAPNLMVASTRDRREKDALTQE